MRTIARIIDQHVESASFQWEMRCNAVHQPHYDLRSLSGADHRLAAHLDALSVAADDGWSLPADGLDWEDQGSVFVAGVTMFQRSAASWDSLTQHVTGVAATGLTSALAWVEITSADRRLRALCSSEISLHRQIGMAATANRRVDPELALNSAASDPNIQLRTRAIKAIGELGRIDLLAALVANLTSEDPACRYWAAWSHVLRAADPLIGVTALQQIAESGGAFAARAAAMAVRRMEPVAARLWYRKLSDVRSAIIAAGAVGDPDAIPWLMEFMTQLPLARVAGESFSMITGADLKYLDLDAKPRPNYDAGPTEDPNDENVELDPDENLPWPDVKLIAKWWAGQSAGYSRGTRYLCGKPMTVENLQEVLRTGYQRQRAAAAIELVLRQPCTVLFNVAAPGFRQKKLLGLSSS